VPEVLLDSDGPVRVITLDAPARRNALVPEMAAEILDVCDRIDRDATAGAVVVTGNGPAFCSGAHRGLLAAAGDDPASDANVEALSAVYEAFTRIGRLAPPVVAAVTGDAVGAGVNLMLAADLRIIAVEARVITGFLGLGVHPGGGHFTLMGRVAGREATAALSLFGERIDGTEAVRHGLAWEALPREAVLPRAIELARRVGQEPKLARAMARAFRDELGPPAMTWTTALEMERGAQMWSLRTTMRLPRPGGS
jgi:enoyl-CoA hydratase